MSGGEHHDVSKHVKAYIGVFIALAVCTVITVGAAWVHMAPPMNFVVALAIACFKASLVAAIFMHLKWESSMQIWMVLGLCALFFAVLMMLPVLTENDMPFQAHRGTWG